jgi:phosphoribosylglycinamide formyltransferase 2
MASQIQSEFEMHAKAVLGLPVNPALHSPAASAVIYGQHDSPGIAFEGVAEALQVESADIRLFGKPQSFARRRMGVALARGQDIETARARARLAASKVKPVVR